MNLVMCNSSCVYQKDGYCMLKNPTVAAVSNKKSDCAYYKEAQSEKAKNVNFQS